ncbi:growth arrest-specific protein 1-like isoform X2 [Artemia franciscana]|uniref:GDNF/GAS1 domain-containing protein n=2 Tax=Artemia franciscana TaxID=6661 RepID=A0AA88LB10_ARTSF|nr:hypothetical protein QYM36_005962 [Artemia franciscana]
MSTLIVAFACIIAHSVAYQVVSDSSEMCQDVRAKCLFRSGCGMAMQNYLVHCADVMTGRGSGECSKACQHALIALTSTEEGQALMRCKCNDTYCEIQKERIDVCRPLVQAAMRSTAAMSCNVATYLCLADAECQTALDFYNRYCRAMFDGRKCTGKCKNSINILRKQEKSENLWTCRCDGTEDYDCVEIRENMAGLCFKKKHSTTTISVRDLIPVTPKTFPPTILKEVQKATEKPSDRTKVPKKTEFEKKERDEKIPQSSSGSKIVISLLPIFIILPSFAFR